MSENDDSFKKAGAVPFKWEIKPGLPKAQLQFNHQKPRFLSPESPSLKLRPPPVGQYPFYSMETRSQSFRSTPRIRSERLRFDRSILLRTESVSSTTSCFLSPFLKRLLRRKKKVPKQVVEPDYTSELETLPRWSLSSRKSFSPFRISTSSSSVASSPRPVSDAEWAGFGLF
ncbi:uncharacterized protein LOC133305627 [Gastrolobium bilobum]|uniref:uncharacterized protein LOC133305627 n=1 Tax=Gastrolobium bilobum TaxID=150636 RepID=UPI002AB0D76F|nr:uncharacterized protein LOC133305627 [Gastrolobium bilobum]